jgi:hypothetical protein
MHENKMPKTTWASPREGKSSICTMSKDETSF